MASMRPLRDFKRSKTRDRHVRARLRRRIRLESLERRDLLAGDVELGASSSSELSGPGLTITETDGGTRLVESATPGGFDDRYEISLDTDPNGSVTVEVVPDAQSLVSIDGLNFSATQILVLTSTSPGDVYVRAVADGVEEGPHQSIVSHEVVNSTSSDYPVDLQLGELTAEIEDAELPPVIGIDYDFSGNFPTDWHGVGNLSETAGTDLQRDDGVATETDLSSRIIGAIRESSSSPESASIPRHAPSLGAIDGYSYTTSNKEFTVTWSDLVAGQEYGVYVFGLEDQSGTYAQDVTLAGVGAVSFTQTLSDGVLQVNDAAGSSESRLLDYQRVVTADASGEIGLTVAPASGSDGISLAGLALQPLPVPQPLPAVSLEIAAEAVGEADGTTATTATVAREGETSSELLVRLTSSDTSEIAVPSTVTIPAGESAVTFDVAAIDDELADGTKTVTVTAMASGLVADVATVEVVDDEVPAISLVVASTEVSESDDTGTVTATVSRNDEDLSAPLLVVLASSDTSELRVPAEVTIPAGGASQSFSIDVVDDTIVDGTQTARISATVPNQLVPDATFGDSGTVTTTVRNSVMPKFPRMAVQPDGKVLATGQHPTLNDTWQITRLNVDGTIDLDFGIDGTANTTVPDASGVRPTSIVIHPDGKITLVGLGTVTPRSWILARYNFDGTPDTSFGTNGLSLIPPTTVDDVFTRSIYNAVLTSDGSMFVTGIGTLNNMFVAKIRDDGSLDPSYGTGGIVVPDLIEDQVEFQTSIAEHPDGGFVIAGSSSNQYYVAKYQVDGTVDTSFGQGGYQTVDLGFASETPESVVVQADGTVTLAGTLRSASWDVIAWGLTRLNGDGSIDSGFGTDGVVILDHGGSSDNAHDLTILQDGRIVVVGSGNPKGNGFRPTLGIFREDGSLDKSFAEGGLWYKPRTGDNESIWEVELAAGGELLTYSGDSFNYRVEQQVFNAEPLVANVDVDVTDDDVATLVLELADRRISEADGPAATTATVSRNTDSNEPLVVMLSSSSEKVTIPTSVTIPTGSDAATFNVDAVDDDLYGPSTSVSLSATASGFPDATAALYVDNDDKPRMTFVIADESVSEGAGPGATTGTISLNWTPTEDRTIEIVSFDRSESVAPSTVVIAAGESSVIFPIDAIDDDIIDGTQTANFTASADAYELRARATLDVTDDDILTLAFADNTVSESEGLAASVATLTRHNDPSDSLTVTLVSSEPDALIVPDSVTIPAGEVTATFNLDAVDDELAYGTRTVVVTASAPPHPSTTASIEFLDNDSALSLAIAPSAFSEAAGAGAATATLSRNDVDLSEPLVVSLTSGDTTEIAMPAEITIPADMSSVTFAVDAVDDMIVDGTQTVTATASLRGYNDGVASVDVLDDDILALALTASPSTISEADGPMATTATVTRNDGDLSSSLEVTLVSSDTSEATVPSTVTIPVGAASATIDIDAVDDDMDDGTQTVMISATASGYLDASASLDVTDDDVATMMFVIADESISEADGRGATTGTITINRIEAEDRTITMVTSDSSEASTARFLTIPAGETSVTFDINAWDDNLADGTKTVTLTARAGAPFPLVTASVDVLDDEVPTLSLTFAHDFVSEGAGIEATSASVFRNVEDLSESLTVALENDDPSELSVSTPVVIPAGESSVTFPVDAVDDAVIDGTQIVTVTPAAVDSSVNYVHLGDSLGVLDDDAPVLTLQLASDEISESAGAAATTATVTRSGDTTEPVTVTLASNDTTKLTVSDSAVIPAGEPSVTFTVDAVEDDLADGTQVVSITASASLHESAATNILVTDDDVAGLVITVADSTISEAEGVGATSAIVTRNTEPSNELVVSLSSSDPSKLDVPATVTIPAGELSSEPFGIDAIDDNTAGGTGDVTITASAGSGAALVDATFGTDGHAELGLAPAGSDSRTHIALQPDGKVIAFADAPGDATGWRLERYHAGGAIDLSFGSDGGVTTTFSESTFSRAHDIKLQSDGKIVVVAYANGGIDSKLDMMVARYEADGSLDPTFGDGGVTRVEFPGEHRTVRDLAIAPDGGILGAGWRRDSTTMGFQLARFQPDGSLDPQFGDDGIVTIDLPHNSTPGFGPQVLVKPDGTILLGGKSGFDSPTEYAFTVRRFDADGTPDAGFGEIGVASIPVGSSDASDPKILEMLLTSTDQIVLAGTVTRTGVPHAVMARITEQGAADTTFHQDGRRIIALEGSDTVTQDLVVDEHDRLLLIGGTEASADASEDMMLVRFDVDGSLDTTFDDDGIATFSLASSPTQEQLQTAILTSSGKLMASLYAEGDPGLVGFDLPAAFSPGTASVDVLDDDVPTLSLTFAETTISEADDSAATTATVSRNDEDVSQPLTVTLTNDDPTELAVPEQVVIPGGESSVTFPVDAVDDDESDGTQTVTVTPVAATTGLDTSFGGGDGVIDSVSNSTPVMALRSDGKFLVASFGSVSGGVLLARYLPDGSFDSSFGAGGTLEVQTGLDGFFPTAMAVQADGSLLMGGNIADLGDRDLAFVRLLEDGSLDATFGDGGSVLMTDPDQIDEMTELSLQADGKIVVVGGFGGDLGVLRLNSDGSVDTAFATSGWFVHDFGLADRAWDVELQADGEIVVAGTVRGGNFDSRIIVGRLLADGSPDPSFGADGFAQTDLDGDYDQGSGVTVAEDGKVLVIGQSSEVGIFPPVHELVVVRYHDDGTVDSGFGDAGVAFEPTLGITERDKRIGILGDGRIVAAGLVDGLAGFQLFSPDGEFIVQEGLPAPDRVFGGLEFPSDNQVLISGDFTPGFVAKYQIGHEELDYVSIDGSIDVTDDDPAPATMDLGDAPLPYPTLIDDDGARHVAVGPTLGPERDLEADGQPSAVSDGDDLAGDTNDEDGIQFVEDVVYFSAHNDVEGDVKVNLQNADPNGNFLDAWIDFNQDGDWDDPGEQIFTSFDLGSSDGIQTLSFTIAQSVESNVVAGVTFSRFRLSTAGNLNPTGLADDGEVEDHTVELGAFAEIRGAVWHDLDSDAVRDESEPGLEGWTLYLDANGNDQFDDGEPTTVTAADDSSTPQDESGTYAFIDLVPGAYRVGQIPQAGWESTFPTISISEIERVSVANDGSELNGIAAFPSLSFDGQFVTFASDATNIVDGINNTFADLFVRDRVTGQIERVSVSNGGEEGNDHTNASSISGDGRFVVFQSDASNLVASDTNRSTDIFVYDRDAATDPLRRISVASDGTEAGGPSEAPRISRDGRYVVFESAADNLVSNDNNGQKDVFLYDLETDEIELVSVAAGGSSGSGSSQHASVSGDGRYVAFSSGAGDLVADDTNDRFDVFVRDRQNGTTKRISLTASGGEIEGPASSTTPMISGNGQFVAYVSTSDQISPEDTNNIADVFVYDDSTGVSTLVSRADDATQGDSGSWDPAISHDGQKIAFYSHASNLVPGDTNDSPDVFLFDVATATVQRMSVADDGAEAPSGTLAWRPAISGDGNAVGFSSDSANLVPGDTNGLMDTFVVASSAAGGGLHDVLVDAGDEFAEVDFGNVVDPKPEVESVVINNGDAQRSSVKTVTVTFNRVVDIDEGSGDPFQFINVDTGEEAEDVPVITEMDGKTVVDFTFLAGPTVTDGGSLADGRYELRIDASLVTSFGMSLDGNGDGVSGDDFVFGTEDVDQFYRKYGDHDGNGTVDLLDFAAFRGTFGKSEGDDGYLDELDDNGDGTVNLLDFAAFRGNFGT